MTGDHTSPTVTTITATKRFKYLQYVCIYVVMKVQKTFSLPISIAEKLDKEENQSALVAELLHNHYEDE